MNRGRCSWVPCGAVFLLLGPVGLAAAQAPATIERLALELEGAEKAHTEATALRQRLCDASYRADTAAVESRALPPASQQEMIRIAAERKAACVQQQANEAQAAKAHGMARESLRVARREPAKVPARRAVADLVAAAAKVQGELDELEVKVNGLYDEVDRATARAMGLTEAKDAPKLQEARELQDLARSSKRSLSQARTHANVFVDRALALKPCLIGDEADKKACELSKQQHYQEAEQAEANLIQELDRIKQARGRLVDIATNIGIAAQWSKDVDRAKAADFARMLRDYPDAKSPFAEDSFQILAGTKPQASIQIVSDKLRAAGWGRWSLGLTRPLGSGQTEAELFGSADGLANGRKITIASESVRLRGALFGSRNVLFATSLEGSIGPKDMEYYADDASAFSVGKKKRTVTDSELGVAFAIHEVSSTNAHLLSVKRQRVHTAATSRIRCPGGADGDVGYVNCLNGSFGAPTEGSSTVLGYEYRYQDGLLGKFAATLGVQYNTHSDVVSVGVPLYLTKSADDPKRPLNAGVRVDWNSKGKASVTGRDRNLWSWGVFVGAPFRLFSGPPSN